MITNYIISQILVVISYIFIAITYQVKERKSILIFSFFNLITIASAYFLLSAYTGFAMMIVSMVRNIIFYIQETKHPKSKTNSKGDVIILCILLLIIIVSSVYTYNGILSLTSVAATTLYTYSIWQKNSKNYKFIGILIEILWIIYNIFIHSIFGLVLECILFFAVVFGYFKEKKEIEVYINTSFML